MTTNRQASITILTPVYNRKAELEKCFSSLLQQTLQDFVWMVVDDGSEESLESLVMSMAERAEFKIVFLRKENGGKHTAINMAAPRIDTELTFILDSDDWLTPDAVEEIVHQWEKYRSPEVGGIFMLTDFPKSTGGVVRFEKEGVFYLREMKQKSRENAITIRTDLLQKHPFPVFAEEKFLAEGCLWIPICDRWKMVFMNKVIRMTEYMPDGLTMAGVKLRLGNPCGMMVNTITICDSKSYHPGQRVKNMISYISYGKFAGKPFMEIIKSSGHVIWAFLSYPLGLLLFFYRRKKYMIKGKTEEHKSR